MANISIIDTGYANTSAQGTQYSGYDIVNSGNEIELKAVRVSYNRGTNIDNTEGPDTNGMQVNQVSSQNPRITIQGIVKRGPLNTTSTSETDLSVLADLDNFCVTKGIKCLYYNDDLTTNTGYPVLTKFLGVTKSGSTETDIYGNIINLANPTSHPDERHFHVRFSNFRITQATDNAYSFSLEGVITR